MYTARLLGHSWRLYPICTGQIWTKVKAEQWIQERRMKMYSPSDTGHVIIWGNFFTPHFHGAPDVSGQRMWRERVMRGTRSPSPLWLVSAILTSHRGSGKEDTTKSIKRGSCGGVGTDFCFECGACGRGRGAVVGQLSGIKADSMRGNVTRGRIVVARATM